MSSTAWTLTFASIASAATILGGLAVVMPGRLSAVRLNHLIAFGAGYILSAAFVAMLPVCFELTSQAPFWILAGYVLAHLFTHTFTSHFHFGEETHHEHVLDPRVGLSALVGLSLHSVFDGVSISSGFLVSPSLGLFIAVAVILHKIPEGVTISSVMVASGRSRRDAMVATTMQGLATLLGAVFMLQLSQFKGIALSISTGIVIYIAATDLIPEFNQRAEKQFSLSALFGILLYFGVFAILSAVGIH